MIQFYENCHRMPFIHAFQSSSSAIPNQHKVYSNLRKTVFVLSSQQIFRAEIAGKTIRCVCVCLCLCLFEQIACKVSERMNERTNERASE